MIGFLILFALLANLVFGFFNPVLASWVFIGVFIGLYEGWICFNYFAHRPDPPVNKPPCYFDQMEADVIKEYHLYFVYPLASREFSSALSGVQLSSFLWVPWLIYNGNWPFAVVIGLNYFVAGFFALKVNPMIILSTHGHNKFNRTGMAVALELDAIRSAQEKIEDADIRL